MKERNKLTEEQARQRLNSQISNLERVEMSNVVLCTLWEYEYTQQQVSFFDYTQQNVILFEYIKQQLWIHPTAALITSNCRLKYIQRQLTFFAKLPKAQAYWPLYLYCLTFDFKPCIIVLKQTQAWDLFPKQHKQKNWDLFINKWTLV